MSQRSSISRLHSENAALRRRMAELEAELRGEPPASHSTAVSRRAREALGRGEIYLRTILENLTEGVIAADLQGNLLQWNRAALEMHGLASPEGQRPLPEVWELFELADLSGAVLPPEQWPLARILRGERLRDLEIGVRRTDKAWERTFNYGGNLVCDEAGQPLMAVVTVSDISVRKRTEEDLRRQQQALRDSQHDLNHAQAVARTGSWRLNVRRNELLWSDETHRIFGVPVATSLSYQNFLDAVHPEDRAYVDRSWAAALRGEPYDIEHRIVVAGEVRWVRERAELEFDGEGALLGGFGTVQDITERKQAEDELRKNREWLRVTLTSIGDAVMAADATGKITFLNPVAVALTGWPLEDALGLPIQRVFRIVNEKTQQPGEDIVGRVLREGHIFELANHTALITRDGQQIPIEDSAAPIRDGAGNIAGVVLVFHEVTEKRRAEEALLEADRRKDEFLAILAHELRNPLAPLRNGLELMKLSKADPGLAAKAEAIMERQLGQMIRLIDDLLDVSRISRGKLELRKECVRLQEAVQNAVETTRPLIDQAHQKLTIELSSDPVYVHADATRLSQVFANLLNNAAKFTPPGGHIRLRAERRGGEALVAVRDDGIGIPAHMLGEIFDLFHQGARPLDIAQSGLGIGLSLVKQLVAMHGGSIEARSEGEGAGSEFFVRLPATSPCSAKGHDEEAGATVHATAHRILVVDDNRDSADSLAMMLGALGHEARTAYNGLDAIGLAAAFRPDLVLLDLGMPKLSGYDTARRMRGQPWGKSTMLVALTGWGQDEDKRRSKEAGFDRHMVKPIAPGDLMKLLSELSLRT
jgi:PAS domain S-box-containing protein